jgi:ribosomal protein L37AE/L43A
MAGYSKEAERQNKALKDLMTTGKTEKDYVQVGYEGKQENLGGETRESELSKVMQSARMPWFCPKCKKAMKKKLDDKFWRIKGHCFDCQIDYENKLRIKNYSEYENYAKTKVLENQKSQLKDLEQSIDDFEKTGGKKTYFNNVGVNTPMLEEDKWEMAEQEFEKTISEARDFIREKRELVEDAEQQLQGAK